MISRSADEEPPHPGSSNGTAAVLGLLRVATGAVTEVADLDDGATVDGWTAAFSPDSARLAYQARDRVRIFTIAGHATTAITPAPGTRLAGKGSWTRDGRHLLLVSGQRCPSCGHYPVRWTVTTVSAATGAAQGPQYRLDGLYAVRVLGWWPSGRPVAAGYTPVAGAGVTLFDDSRGTEKLVSLDDLDTVRLLELGPGSGHRELSAIGTETVDVADDVLAAGRIGAAQVPAATTNNVLLGLGAVAGTAAALALLAAARLLWGRRRRKAAAGG